jgi:hypothetical protein
MKFLMWLAAAAMLAAGIAVAQIQQSGSVTAGHVGYWVYNNVLGDPGPATNSLATEFGLTKNGGFPFCINDFPITNMTGYAQLCLAQSNTEADIYETSFNAPTVPIYLDYNGVKYNLLAQISSIANVANIASLRGGNYSQYTTLNVVGYYDTQYEGGGLFTRGASGCVDNGGTIIEDSGTNCWYRQPPAGSISQDVLAWGAHCDGVSAVNDGSIAQGSTQFTSSTITFTGADVGKYFEMDSASNPPFLTHIASVNGHTATLAFPAPVAYPGNYTVNKVLFSSTVDGGNDAPGTGYVPNPSGVVSITGGTPITPATFAVVATGLVSVTQTSGGSNYQVNDLISLYSLTGNTSTVAPATVLVTSVDGSGAITGFKIAYGGIYRSNTSHINPATFKQTGGNGSGWTFNLAAADGSFGVSRIVFLSANGGSYSVPPPTYGATTSGGGGTGATVDTITNAASWGYFSDDTTAIQAVEAYSETTPARGVYGGVTIPSGKQCFAQSLVLNQPIAWSAAGPKQGFLTMILGSAGQAVNGSRPAFVTMATGLPFDGQNVGANEPLFSNLQITGQSSSPTVYIDNTTVTTSTDCFELVTPGSVHAPHSNTGMAMTNMQIESCPGNALSATIWAGEIIGYNIYLKDAGNDCFHLENASNPTRFYRLVITGCTAVGIDIIRSGQSQFYGMVVQKSTLPVSVTGFFGHLDKSILFTGMDEGGAPNEAMYLDQQGETVHCVDCLFRDNNQLGSASNSPNDSDILVGPDASSGNGAPIYPVITFDSSQFDSASTDNNVFFQLSTASTYCQCDVVADGLTQNINNGQLTSNNSAMVLGPVLYSPAVAPPAPLIASGFGTGPPAIIGNGTSAFQVTVGSGGVATTGSLTLPTATNGWVCTLNDVTHAIITTQTGSTTTSASFTAASAWNAADKLNGGCNAF